MKTFNIAIIGSGPAGMFSAMSLQQAENDAIKFNIDIFEKLPIPWGLVRTGVAPDHQNIKKITEIFEKIAGHQRIRLFCNFEVGNHISLKELREHYDATILAIGASKKKLLNIPGENLKNSFSSVEITSWYNSHPEFSELEVDLEIKTAVIIGAGNVAIDLCRILAKKTSELKSTDINPRALKTLEKSQIEELFLISRRGPEHVSFSRNELRELSEIDSQIGRAHV